MYRKEEGLKEEDIAQVHEHELCVQLGTICWADVLDIVAQNLSIATEVLRDMLDDATMFALNPFVCQLIDKRRL